MPKESPIRDTDEEARAQAKALIAGANFAALAFTDTSTGAPSVTRVALTRSQLGAPMTLISDLSAHTRGLRASPECGLLVGEPGAKGDPLTHPRLSISAEAKFVEKTEAARDHYLAQYPKAKLYFDFADFHLVEFQIRSAALNGGFGKAYNLTPEDLA